MRVEVAERFKNYSKPHCWQYDIRLQNAKSDLHELALSPEEVSLLSTKDFSFSPVDKGDKSQCDEIRDFIERHEWLGKLPARPTHRFTARLSSTGDLAGVIIMATPNAFSHILGRDNKDKEKLICTILFANNLVNVLASALATKILIELISFSIWGEW